VPEGCDRDQAKAQIIEFLKMVAPMAQEQGITIVIEHLNRKECNIINSLDEAMTYVREVNHPNVQCLVDSYHFWMENEPLASIASAGGAIKHVHVADKDGRVAPGLSGTADYGPFFTELKRAGYNGPISVEATGFDIAKDAGRVLEFLKEQWNKA